MKAKSAIGPLYAYEPSNPGETVENQPHGGYQHGEANDETAEKPEMAEDGTYAKSDVYDRYTDHHNPNMHNRRTLITENEGDHIRDATPEDGASFVQPMRADIEES